MTLQIGDPVVIGPNPTKAPEGAVGRLHGFSTAGKANTPIVDVPRRGRFLVPLASLTAHEGPVPGERGDAPPLGDETTPVPGDAAPPRPALDWFEPAPQTPATEEQTMPGSWTEERRARYKETIARKQAERGVVRVAIPRADDADPPRDPRPAAPAPAPDPTFRSLDGLTIRDPAPVDRIAPQRAVEEPPVTRGLATMAAPGIGTLGDELAASVAALRRGIAAAAIEGEPVERLAGLTRALANLETAIAGGAS